MQSFAILVIQGTQYFLCQRFGKIHDQVGKVVEFHALDGNHEFFSGHAFDQTIADLVRQFDEYVAFDLGADHFPDHGSLAQWQRLEQARQLRRMQRTDQHARRAHAAAVELLAQQ